MSGTVPSIGDMQGKGGRNPCPQGDDTLIGERDNKYIVKFQGGKCCGKQI